MNRLRRTILLAAMAALLVGGMAAIPAQAQNPVGCGAIVTHSITLTEDLDCKDPNADFALMVDENTRDIAIDLGGHTLRGGGSLGDPGDERRHGTIGILVSGADDVKIVNGTVERFHVGIVIANSDHPAPNNGDTVPDRTSISDLHVQDNIGNLRGDDPGSRFGDGILVAGADAARISDSTIEHNGPYSGIAMISEGELPRSAQGSHVGKTTNTVVMNNEIWANYLAHYNEAGVLLQEDIGIRIEPFSDWNRIGPGNKVHDNGLDGIAVFRRSDGNEIFGNDVYHNGYHIPDPVGGNQQRYGNGILVFGPEDPPAGGEVPSNQLIGGFIKGHGDFTFPATDNPDLVRQGNTVRDNAASGIRIGRSYNTMVDNEAGGNAAVPHPNGLQGGADAPGVRAADYVDVPAAQHNPSCPIPVFINVWDRNFFLAGPRPGTDIPGCIVRANRQYRPTRPSSTTSVPGAAQALRAHQGDA